MLKSCGLKDAIKNKNCSRETGPNKTCSVEDYWIQGINDKPLSFHSCKNQEHSEVDRTCRAACEQELIGFRSELMLLVVRKYASENNWQISEDCFKKLENIDNITQSYCMKEDQCNDKPCNKDELIDATKKCRTTTSPPKTSTTTVNATFSGGSAMILEAVVTSRLIVSLLIHSSFWYHSFVCYY